MPKQIFFIQDLCKKVLRWCETNHPGLFKKILLNEFCNFPVDSEQSTISTLESMYSDILHFHCLEWFIADSLFELPDGSIVRTADMLLKTENLKLTAEEKEMIFVLKSNNLSFYEVIDIKPKESTLYLRQLPIKDKKNPIVYAVYDKKASETTEKGMILGLRVIDWKGKKILSGCTYLVEIEFYENYLISLKKTKYKSNTPFSFIRNDQALLIVWTWLDNMVDIVEQRGSQINQTIIDYSTGEPMVLNTDIFVIKDEKKVLNFLASKGCISHDGDKTWVWLEVSKKDGLSRPLAFFDIVKPHLKVRTRTDLHANDLKNLIQQELGQSVTYKIRQIEDPISSAGFGSKKEEPIVLNQYPPDMGESHFDLINTFKMKFYENWENESIPALGNKTPKEMVKTKAGKKKVLDLIATYQLREDQEASMTNRPSLSYDFLKVRVGLE